MNNKKLNQIGIVAQAMFYWVVLNVLFAIWSNVSDDGVSLIFYILGYLSIIVYGEFKE